MSQRNTMKALGYQRITSLAAAAGLAPPKGATKAIIRCETQGVRWRDDGVAPTATVGMPLNVGDVLTYDAFNPAAQALYPIQFIEQAASALLNVSYYE